MYQFTRTKVLPLFLQRRMTIRQLAKDAGVSEKTAERAINGLPVHASVIGRIADALGIAPLEMLVDNGVEIRD